LKVFDRVIGFAGVPGCKTGKKVRFAGSVSTASAVQIPRTPQLLYARITFDKLVIFVGSGSQDSRLPRKNYAS